jgi:hypothetical protein
MLSKKTFLYKYRKLLILFPTRHCATPTPARPAFAPPLHLRVGRRVCNRLSRWPRAAAPRLRRCQPAMVCCRSPGAPSCPGVGLSRRRPRGACPTGLWHLKFLYVGLMSIAHTLAYRRFAGPIAETVARLATGAGGLTLRWTSFAPAGRRTTFPEGVATSNPLRPAGPGHTAFPISLNSPTVLPFPPRFWSDATDSVGMLIVRNLLSTVRTCYKD